MRSRDSISPSPSPPPPEDDESEEPPLPEDDPSDDDFSDDPPPPDFESVPSDFDDNEDIEDFEDFPDDSDQPTGKKDSNFILPVSAAGKTTRNTVEERTDTTALHKQEPLTSGLIIKEPPVLLKKSQATIAGPMENSPPQVLPVRAASFSSASVDESVSFETSTNKNEAGRITSAPEGFMEGKGRFDGDTFETLFLKVDREAKSLNVMVESGDVAVFNLAEKAFVYEDVEDPTMFILDYQKNMIIFKFDSADLLMSIMKHMPEEVFMAAEHEDVKESEITEKLDEERTKGRKQQKPGKAAPQALGVGPKIDHVKGTSVEDILENDFETQAERRAKIDLMFQVRETNPTTAAPPQRRKELIETYIRKPKYSVRRVSLLCEWINSLKVWSRPLTIVSLHKEICTGILLSNVFKALKPDVEFINLHDKAMVKKTAISNLEQVLGHIWRAKSLNNSRIPSAEDIYSGNTAKTAILLNELFAVYILRPLYKNALRILRWYHHILKQYQRPLPAYVFDDGDLSGVWPHFQSGTALFCVIYHFFGATSIGKGTQVHQVDPLKIAGDPSSICDFRSNLSYVFSLLQLLDVDIIWTAEDWISNPDTEFVLFQLSLIYDKLRDQQCTLPPAHGDKPGLTSGPNGEALVIGMVFSDAPSNLKFLPKTRKAVRLGHDSDSMPLIPVDHSFRNPRFAAGGSLPQGMISKKARIAQISLPLRESRSMVVREDWNGRTKVDTSKDNCDNAHIEALLRVHQKRGNGADASVAEERGLNLRKSLTNAFDHESVHSYKLVASEINQMVRSLEEEMHAAKDRIRLFEEDLANRYLRLEGEAHLYGLVEYESALSALDKERSELEQEKKRLQDYFTRKFAFIRERKENSQISQETLISEFSRQKAKEEKKSAKASKKPVSRKIDTEAAERGWITLSSAKPETHNFHLRNKQSVAIANFKAKITPKSLLMKEQLREGSTLVVQQISSHPLGLSGAPDALPTESSVEHSFQKFKLRLMLCTQKYMDSLNPKNRSTLQEIMNTGRKQSQVELISLPRGSVAETRIAEFRTDFHPAVIREEELDAMRYEDERRNLYLSENSLEQTLNLSAELFQNVTQTPTHSSPVPRAAQHESTIIDLDSALTFLAKTRSLILNDRVPKEFLFTLVNTSSGESDEVKFALEWREPDFSSNYSSGSVLLDDIHAVEASTVEPDLFNIRVIETPRALKNSKGRALISVKCDSAEDARSYIESLNYVLHMCRS